MLTEVAVTVPSLSAAPWTVAHFPATTDFDVVEACVETVVSVPMVMVFLVVVGAADPPFGSKASASMTTDEPDTETTLPVAMPPKPRAPPPVPPGPPDGNPVGAPDGRTPLAPPEPFPPPGPPKPRPHSPLVAALTVTVVAVKEVAAWSVPVGAIAVTQEPALIAEIVTVTL